MLERDVELQALEPAVGVGLERGEHPRVRALVVLEELDALLRKLPPVALLHRPGVVRDAQAFVAALQVEADVDPVEPPRVLRGRDPQRAGEHGERAGGRGQLPGQRSQVLPPTTLVPQHHPPRDPRVRRHRLHEHLQARALTHGRHGRDGAEVGSAEEERRVADGETAGGLDVVAVQRGSLLHARRRRRVRRDDQLRWEEGVRLTEPLLERPVGMAHQSLARADVERDGGLAHVDAPGHHALVRGALHLGAPLAARVRGPNAPPRDLLGLVGHGHDHGLLQVRPVDVNASVEKVRVSRRAARALLGADQKRRVPAAAHAHDERLLLARGAKDVDPRVLELAA